MFADGALVEGELVLDQVHGKEEYGTEIDQGAYAWRGQASWEYHDDGEKNALWEVGLFFIDTFPRWDHGHKYSLGFCTGRQHLAELIIFGGAAPLETPPQTVIVSLFRV
jgi:hypothetical protein